MKAILERMTEWSGRFRCWGKQKIFCVGANKTGTTSLARVFMDLGYVIGNQHQAELLLEDWVRGDYSGLTAYCRTAQFFQDVPFSLPGTYRVVDETFPGSRFILTVRDSAEQWYQSLVSYHSQLWANGRIPPTREDLQNATYIYKGRPWVINRLLFKTPEDDPYHKETLIAQYQQHNEDVLQYFKNRKDDLLVLNVAGKDSALNLFRFLKVPPLYTDFPWLNRTAAIPTGRLGSRGPDQTGPLPVQSEK